MKAVIYHSVSKEKICKGIAESFEGDHFEIKPLKPINNRALQYLIYGFRTAANQEVKYQPLDIDFHKYEEIILVSPVMAGQVNAYMRQFLKDNKFHDKQVRIITNCKGGYKKYFSTYKGLIDGCCEVIEKTVYIKGVKQ